MIRLLGVDDIVRIHDAILGETGIGLPDRLDHESLTERIADHLHELVAARETRAGDEAPPTG